MENIKVLIIEAKNENRKLMSETLSKVNYINLVGETEDLEEVSSLLKEFVPDIVLLGNDFKFDRYMITNYISSEYPETMAIMIENELKEDTMSKAIFAGAKDVIISPFTASELLDAIHRSYQVVKAKNLFADDEEETITERKPSKIKKTKTQPSKRRNRKGKVITLFSTKGGVGKTFLSINVAASLARLTDQKVCLVDFDLDFGNVALALDVIPTFTISDVVDDISNLDQDLIQSYLANHESGIKLLPANAKPLTTEFITAEHTEIILKVLREAFDYVIIDMPARFYEPVNPAFQITDLLLMITAPEIATIRNTKAAIETLNELNFPKSKIKVILNKADNRGKIKPKNVERTIDHSLFSVVEADYKYAMLSLNTGVPVVLSKRFKGISRSIKNLSKDLVLEFENN